jgi:protein tyrosine/serine phosphatase
MSIDRTLDWDGCHNVRDLGGLAAAGGRKTRWGAIVRSAKIDGLTPAGWAALVAHGIRTIIDLREPAERMNVPPRPDGVTTVNIPLDDAADTDLWDHIREQELDGTPLYYPVFLEHKPERCAAAISAVAQAAPGGVLIHCAAGWDRTGLVALLLLALAGVGADDIATDYLLSGPNMRPVFLNLGYDDPVTTVADIHARKGITPNESIAETLASLGGDGYLLAAGVSKADIAALRDRLLD